MSAPVDAGDPLDRMYAALAAGDVEAALACLTDDAVVWHCFDGVAEGRAAIRAGWEALVAGFPERGIADAWRAPVPGGFVQRHVMYGRTASGARKAWACALFVTVRDGLVARIDEYIDRAGAFDWEEGRPVRTPGLGKPTPPD